MWWQTCFVNWQLHRNTYKTNMHLYWCSKLHDSHLSKSNSFDLKGKQTQTQLGYNRGDWGRFNVVTWMLKVCHLFMKLQGTLPWSGPHPDHLIAKLQTLYNRGQHRPVDNALWMRVSNKKKLRRKTLILMWKRQKQFKAPDTDIKKQGIYRCYGKITIWKQSVLYISVPQTQMPK